MFNQIGGLNAIGAPLGNDVIGGEDFIRHPGADKLIFDFKSGSGTVVYDKSREGNDGTLGSGAAAPTWKRNSLYFDGGDNVDLVGIGHGVSTGEFTLCFFLDEWAATGMVIDQETVRMYLYNFASTVNFTSKIISDTGISTTLPIFVQITRDISGNLECYINGKSQNKGQSLTTDFTYNGISAVKLGSRYSEDSTFITGTMYSFRILNKGLSGIEAFQIYLSDKFKGNN